MYANSFNNLLDPVVFFTLCFLFLVSSDYFCIVFYVYNLKIVDYDFATWLIHIELGRHHIYQNNNEGGVAVLQIPAECPQLRALLIGKTGTLIWHISSGN